MAPSPSPAVLREPGRPRSSTTSLLSSRSSGSPGLPEASLSSPLPALGSAVPGVVQWKPGAYSPLVRVRGAVACAARLGEIIVVLLEEESGSRSMIGLMLKPRCGRDGLAAAVDATTQAPAARGQLPLKAYRRQQQVRRGSGQGHETIAMPPS